MSDSASPWVRSRGLGRLLAQETNVSDLIQYLSDRDPSPWANLVGFVPDAVVREALDNNRADLLLTSATRTAVVEVKLGNHMSAAQQERYEKLPSQPDLFLAALRSDEVRLAEDLDGWTFLSLCELIGCWNEVDDELARLLSREAADVIGAWDQTISGVLNATSPEDGMPLSKLNQRFLGCVVTRRIAYDLWNRDRLATAGVTKGGGLPILEAWTPVRDEDEDRTFIAEVRWSNTKLDGELRFGVDFDPRPGQDEDEELRRAAYGLARSMDADLDFASLGDYLSKERPDLAALLHVEQPSRPQSRGDWEQVLLLGFKGMPRQNGKKHSRQETAPDFYGDGALCYEAKVDIDFQRATARDLTDLIDTTLAYLSVRQP